MKVVLECSEGLGFDSNPSVSIRSELMNFAHPVPDATDSRFEARQEPLNHEATQRYLDSADDVYKRVLVNQPPTKDVTYSPTNNNYNNIEANRDQRNQTPTSGSYNLDEGRT